MKNANVVTLNKRVSLFLYVAVSSLFSQYFLAPAKWKSHSFVGQPVIRIPFQRDIGMLAISLQIAS